MHAFFQIFSHFKILIVIFSLIYIYQICFCPVNLFLLFFNFSACFIVSVFNRIFLDVSLLLYGEYMVYV